MPRDLMAKRDDNHQRVLQIRSTRLAVEAYKDVCRILQKYTRARKSEWWEMKTEEPQRADDRNDMKGFYSGLKEVWGPQTTQHVHLRSSDGVKTFTDSKSVMARWSQYIQKLLNIPGDMEPEALETYKSTVSILPWMKWLERSRDSKIEKHLVETEFQQKYGNTAELICSTDCTDGSSKYGRKVMFHKHGRMPFPTWKNLP